MHPDYLPKTLTGRLVHLIEEAAEVQKAVTKILRFGPDNYAPGALPGDSNRDRLLAELVDLERAIAFVREAMTDANAKTSDAQAANVRVALQYEEGARAEGLCGVKLWGEFGNMVCLRKIFHVGPCRPTKDGEKTLKRTKS